MAIQPTHHWQFNEREGSVVKDSITGAEATLRKITLEQHGRIGNAIKINGNGGFVDLGNEIGQFGTSDFTIAFGMRYIDRHKDGDLDVIGNRNISGHGNWISVRQQSAKITFEVDEDSKGKNYIIAKTEDLVQIQQKKWFHIAFVRQGTTLKVYVDGVLSAEGQSPDGVANVNNGVSMRLGDLKRGAAVARYEDLRIYHTALNELQIQNLVTPFGRLLRVGEVELIAADDAAVILNADDVNLFEYSDTFQKVRLGPNTGITLYRNTDFGSASQKLYADVPEIRHTRVDAFPKSVQVWRTAGDPFTGKWIIAAPNGDYLSRDGVSLTTASEHFADEYFVFHFNTNYDQPQLLPVNDQGISQLRVDGKTAVLMVDDTESRKHEFSITNTLGTQWLTLNANNTFSWTREHSDRAIFDRIAKLADNEGQVGELSPGEVALYEHIAYQGRAWILSDFENDTPGYYNNFKAFEALDNRISSVRLGPDTGVTLFVNPDQSIGDGKRETDVEDIVENTPDLRQSQVGNDTLSSIQIFRTVEPDTILESFTSKLSQDYRLVDDEIEEFSSYRTTLRFAPGVSEVEISATDFTTIEVEGTRYEIDEVTSVTLAPNAINRIMITSEADGILTPGLKFRTSDMAENERVVIFPDEEVHKQIAELEADALWNATDANGNLIVDQTKHTRSEIAAVQNTIKRTMATVVTPDEPASPVEVAPTPTNLVARRSFVRSVTSSTKVVSSAPVNNPWTLNFTNRPASNGSNSGLIGGGASLVLAGDPVHEQDISQDAFEQMMARVEVENTVAAPAPTITTEDGITIVNTVASLRSFRSIFKDIKDAVKGAASVTIGFVKDTMNILVEIGGKIVKFVLDTAAKVVTFVEAVIEKVVESIKQFIEFIRFLFDWGDILETQRYMVKAINSAFDSASALVDSAKKPVARFIDGLQDEIEDGINNAIRGLGVDPDREDPSSFDLPEAAEWFLNLIFGESKKSDKGSLTPSEQSNDGPAIIQAFQHLLEAFRDVIGIGAEILDGFFDTIETLITNPRHPELALVEILETVRDVAIQALDFGEEVVFAFLDFIVAAIDLLRDILNFAIPIRFIEKLFDFIGAGKPTILNLTSILLAIPTTVVSKLIFGVAPFKDTAQPEFPSQQSALLRQSLSADEPIGEVEPTGENTPKIDIEDTRRKMRGFGILAIISDVINGIINTGLDLTSEENDDDGDGSGFLEVISLVLSGFSWLSSFPGSPKEPGGYPYDLCNPDNDPSTEAEKRELVMWGWRTAVLGFDIGYVIAAFVAKASSTVSSLAKSISEKMPRQRLRRSNEALIVFNTLLALGDLVVTWRFLRTVERSDKRGKRVANEVLGMLPGIFCGLRLAKGQAEFPALAGLFILNVIATGPNTLIAIELLQHDVEGLRELEEEQATPA